MYEEITPQAVERLIEGKGEVSIIDVREPWEFAKGHIPGAKNISVNELLSRLDEIDKTKDHIIVCHSGNRSGVASAILSAHGYTVKNMAGGMLEWNGQVVC
ncbi:rhodanese-like domain-containing protein [Sporolactobacillus vineae]|uniref:rhodanese-like domain-containing protein n=1 Tax=Sporolactobacillus vineae TaxID=444463 RepID=UPI000287E1CE|nr:rhodanese-like domain-containing protein [Sporolactobacillus vineae]